MEIAEKSQYKIGIANTKHTDSKTS